MYIICRLQVCHNIYTFNNIVYHISIIYIVWLHFIIVNIIIVKNTCVGKRMGRHGYISLLRNLLIVKSRYVSHNNPFAVKRIGRQNN